MIPPYLRFLAGRERSEQANRHLGLTLAFVAGAVNAGGFLTLSHYTSHVTGVMSSVADEAVLGRLGAALTGASVWASFAAGAFVCALLVLAARARRLRSEYALVLLVEAVLLLLYGLTRGGHFALQLLSFIMGLQNAVITKLSGAEIRTTHMTGNTTDLGIEAAKVLFAHADDDEQTKAEWRRLKIHSGLLLFFMLGGFSGALAFQRFGSAALLPVAALLMIVAAGPLIDDLLGSADAG